MNLLGTSGVAEDESGKHARMKTGLTAHLKLCIKVLQNDYIKSDTPIHSGDNANALCNVLEAIFLHQLKPSIGSKLSSYFVGRTSETDAHLSCWPFLQKFTHKDVVSQLIHLSQINTDIGMCRAWIRLALNEGLLVNYLDAMIADSATCRYFYKRTAYMRDLEQPGIMKTYIQGLSNLNLQLSCNSSVLNAWTTAPLILTGHADPPQPTLQATAPSVVIRPVTLPSRIAPVVQSQYTAGGEKFPSPDGSSVSHPVTVRRHRVKRKHLPLTPPNTPFSANLTRRDVDEIRQMALRCRPRSDGSESTATSQISCPDSTDGRQFDSVFSSSFQLTPSSSKLSVVSEDVDRQRWLQDVPSVLEATETEAPETTFRNECLQHIQQGSTEEGVWLDKVEREVADKRSVDVGVETEQSIEDVNVKKTCEVAIKMTSEKHMMEQVKMTLSETAQQVTATLTETLQQVTATRMESSQQVMATPTESSQQVTATPMESSQQVTATPMESSQQVTATPTESSKLVMATPMESSSEDTALAAAIRITSNTPEPSSSNDTTKTIPQDKMRPTTAISEFHPVRKGIPLKPQLSDVTACFAPVDPATEVGGETDAISIDSREGYLDSDTRGASNEAFIQGNSLGSMQGWSSEFENGAPETRVLPTEGGSLEPKGEEARESHNAETFVALLENYDHATHKPSPTSPSALFETASGREGRYPSITSQDSEQDTLDDFVMLRPDTGTNSCRHIVDPQYEHLVELIGEICHEKGLDMQNYQCRGCSRPVGMFYGKARVCTYNAGYYCYECHENDEYYIPSRIVHNWDFRKHKVCKQNLDFLQQTKTASLINVQKINRRLYDHVNEMNNSRVLRIQLRLVKKYLFTCKQCVADELRRRVSPREYLYEDIHLYSLVDLLQIHDNQFTHKLHKVIQFGTKHIYNCLLCRQKGFICELCNNPQVIYPFQLDITTQCDICHAVYHKTCKTDMVKCPKCVRYAQRRLRLGSHMTSGFDYADDPAQD